MRPHEKYIKNAKYFLKNALKYKEQGIASDAISRIYYACFHVMLAYLHFRGKAKKLPVYVRHSELREAYCDLYDAYSKSEETHGLRAFVFRRKPFSVLERWQRIREDADYKVPYEDFDQLPRETQQDFYLMVEFAKAHISYIEKAEPKPSIT